MLSNEWLILGWVAVAVTGIAFIVLNRVWIVPARRRAEMLADPNSDYAPVFGNWTGAWAAQVPLTKDGQSSLRSELLAAGHYQPTAVQEYAAVRNVLVLLAVAGTGLAVYFQPAERLFVTLGFGLCAVLLAFSLPRVYLAIQARTRWRQIERGLPLAIDLLTLCLSAGQNILTALHYAQRELKKTVPALGQEFAILEQQTRLYSLEEALGQLAQRVRVPELKNLCLLLMQSERLGTDTAATLDEYATSMRATFRHRAEAHASRASFWMLFPSVFCLFVAAAIVLIGPTYLEFWQFRRESQNLLNQGLTGVNQLNNQPGATVTTTTP